MCLAGTASAGTIEYTLNGTLRQVGGTDNGGYDGASMTFAIQFDDTVAYGSFFGSGIAVSMPGATVEIAGASVGSSNALYTTGSTLNFLPGFGDIVQGGGSPTFSSAGVDLRLILSDILSVSAGSSNATAGTMMELDDFYTGPINLGGAAVFLPLNSAGDQYTLDNVSALASTVAIVPLPGGFGLAALGLGALATTRYIRNAQ